MLEYTNTKDFMPLWGPYSKKYMGISKAVQDSEMPGARFDLVVFPTVANSAVPVPNVTVPSNYHPWQCTDDYGFFSYRYDLQWKDKMYADVSFSKIDAHSYLVRTQFYNNTDLQQNCLLNLFCAMEYPYKSRCELTLPQKHCDWSALDYTEYSYAVSRPWDMLNPDGAKKGEFFDCRFVDNKGLGDRVAHDHVPHLDIQPFGCCKGDRVAYEISAQSFSNAVLAVRYRTVGDTQRTAEFESNFTKDKHIRFAYSEEPSFAYFPIGEVREGVHSITLTSLGGGGLELDCFAIVESNDTDKVIARQTENCTVPKMTSQGKTINYQYDRVKDQFYLHTFSPKTRYRILETGTLEDALITRLSNSDHTFDDLTKTFTKSFLRKHSDDGFYHNTILHSIYLKPHTSKTEYAVVSDRPVAEGMESRLEEIYQKAKQAVTPLDYNQAGKKYELSNQILRATTLTNVVYPIYRHGRYIIHHTPGKRWDCLYTWDSGFIGLGLLEVNPAVSEYILDLYLSEEKNKDFAFLHHGSPVPVQFYLYLELLKRSNEKSRLYRYYPRIKKYYDFIAGKKYGSSTARLKSGLTTTYDYFYSTSGMDDYPAQVAMHEQGLEKSAAPAISTSQVIRCAKILKQVAAHLQCEEDEKEFDADIARMAKALQTYSWDGESGYFSYVLHDENGNPKERFKTPQGENWNKGMDGIYPLIAGACTDEQERRILGHLQSEKEMLSRVGISAVDMSSGYYIDNGYWNGNVWFSHQWFIWKTMLDLGKADFAFQIADIALNSWKNEVDDSYYTFEMLNIETGRGGWYHQFGGLSSPVNIWANAYYKKGTVSSGFDLWIEKQQFEKDGTACTVVFENGSKQHSSTMIVVMKEDESLQYQVTCNGEPISSHPRVKGTLEIMIPQELQRGTIRIAPLKKL